MATNSIKLIQMNSIKVLFSSLTIATNKTLCTNIINRTLSPAVFTQCSQLHATPPRRDLMEFFDEKKNWGENEVKVGRSWKKDDLRIKSNTDLHKLWFVLSKERNMLLTMEHDCKENCTLFPSPERLDKVKESMTNLEDVVRERNRAYFELETGESGERPGKVVNNALGLRFFYRMREHCIPKFMNRRWHETHQFGYRGHAVHKFLKLYREKIFLAKKRAHNRDRGHVMGLIKRFPNMNDEALSQQYPNVDIDDARKHKKTLGHHENNSA